MKSVLLAVAIVVAGCADQLALSGVFKDAGATASAEGLIYVANSRGVRVFTYPQGKLTTTITGLIEPGGECVDSSGDVFIVASANASYNSSSIYEYAYGGTTPIAVFSDPGAGYGCSVDPNTGNIAVANGFDRSNPYHPGYGDVAIYSKSSSSPTMYYTSEFVDFYPCGYDDASNLYIYGTVNDSSHTSSLGVISKGSSAITRISLNKSISGSDRFIPSLQWDGEHMTVSSDSSFGHKRTPVSIYRFTVSGANATVIGTTKLSSKKNLHGGQSWISGSQVFGVYYYRGSAQLAFWNYPKGGSPKTIAKDITSGNYAVSGLVLAKNSSGFVTKK